MTWHDNDPIMIRLVKTLPAPAISIREDLYLALIEAIVSQQLSTRVADVIFARFCALFDDGYPHAQQVLALETDKLRSAGLSGQKANYIRNIADFHCATPIVAANFANHTDEEVIAHLTQIKGVGRWTVQMLLMFPMNRPDVFPIDDLGIRQSMIQLYGVTETGKELHKRLHAIAETWQPNRTLACKYLWKARDTK
jgi:DNA-3-methyladenine glycosylase II